MSSFLRLLRGPLIRRSSKYSTAAPRQQARTGVDLDVVQKIEQDGARILRIVKNRVEERINLLSQISEDTSTSEDIVRARQVKELEPVQRAWDEWVHTAKLLRETTPLLSDSDPTMRALALEEYDALTSALSRQVCSTFPSLLVPPSSTAHLSAVVELKSGVGGSEASLFLGDLLRVYLRFANSMKWKTQILAKNMTERGGIKDAIIEIKGVGSYDALRWESGVHRVQRVPETEESGRTHTSTVAAVVLPLSDGMDEHERDDDLFSMDDVKIEVMRARGAGGQHVNKTESAVRLTHHPTGITVSMQDERSQHQNKRRAFQVLRARLMDVKLAKEMKQRRTTRKNLVRTADRSEKIRTYNYSQDRVTDHRVGLSLMNLTSFMEGDGLETFINALNRDHDESVLEDLLADS